MEHPIAPPPELVQQWADMLSHRSDHAVFSLAARWGADQQLKLDADQIAQSYQAGADQELEACCGFIGSEHSVAWSHKLRTNRRPKPPSLKEQALKALGADGYSMLAGKKLEPVQLKIIRRALEQLDD
jgi:hypothetical protein